MKNTYPIGTPLTFVWRFQNPDGSPIVFVPTRFHFSLRYTSGRGEKYIQTFAVNPEGDGITWTLPAKDQIVLGTYDLVLDIFLDGKLIEHYYYRKAFSLYQSAKGTINTAQYQESATINLLSVGEFYHFMTGEVINTPDEEDITSDSKNLLKFKDRTSEDGMGYVILRKNKSFAEQLTAENIIYEIRYDFDLDGESVTVPAGCVLQFVGGSLQNGVLVFQNTCIKADAVQIFSDIDYSGKVLNPINALWFGAIGDGSTENDEVFSRLFRCSATYDYSVNSGNAGNTIYLPKGTYVHKNSIYLRKGDTLLGDSQSNTSLFGKGTDYTPMIIMGKSTAGEDPGGYAPVVKNIWLQASTGMIGIQASVSGWIIENCWFMVTIGVDVAGVDGLITNCIQDMGSNFIRLRGASTHEVYNNTHSVIISNCITYACGYASILALGGYGININNCAFYYSKSAAISIEGNVGGLLVNNCDFRTSNSSSYYTSNTRHIDVKTGGLVDSMISNCFFTGSRDYSIVIGGSSKNVKIDGCQFEHLNGRGIYIPASGGRVVVIQNNLFNDITSYPVYSNVPAIVKNNTFINVDFSDTYPACIAIDNEYSANSIVTDNINEGQLPVARFTTTSNCISRYNISRGDYDISSGTDMVTSTGERVQSLT